MGLLDSIRRGVHGATDTGASWFADKAKRDMLTDAARELRDEQWVKDDINTLKRQNWLMDQQDDTWDREDRNKQDALIQAQADRIAKWNHDDDLLVQKEEIDARAAEKLATANASLYKIKKETTHRLDTQHGGYKTPLKEQTAIKNTVDLVLGEDYETSTENTLSESERVEVKRNLHASIESRNRSLRSNGYNVPLIEVGRLLLADQPVPKIPAKELEGIYKYTSAKLAEINAKLAAATPPAATPPAATPPAATPPAANTTPSLEESGETGVWRNNQRYSKEDWNAINAADKAKLWKTAKNIAFGGAGRQQQIRDGAIAAQAAEGQQPTSATAQTPTKVSRKTERESTEGKRNPNAYTAKQADLDRKSWMSFYQRNSGIPYNPLGLNSLFKPKKK